jgi:hypothetical protein
MPLTHTDTLLLKTLEHKLSDLAAFWRANKNTPEAETIVRQYHAVLHCMIELGFHAPLDVDSELPRRFMPPEYFALFNE